MVTLVMDRLGCGPPVPGQASLTDCIRGVVMLFANYWKRYTIHETIRVFTEITRQQQYTLSLVVTHYVPETNADESSAMLL
jgi:hypothetical protein